MRKINNSANIFNIIDIAHTAFSIDGQVTMHPRTPIQKDLYMKVEHVLRQLSHFYTFR